MFDSCVVSKLEVSHILGALSEYLGEYFCREKPDLVAFNLFKKEFLDTLRKYHPFLEKIFLLTYDKVEIRAAYELHDPLYSIDPYWKEKIADNLTYTVFSKWEEVPLLALKNDLPDDFNPEWFKEELEFAVKLYSNWIAFYKRIDERIISLVNSKLDWLRTLTYGEFKNAIKPIIAQATEEALIYQINSTETQGVNQKILKHFFLQNFDFEEVKDRIAHGFIGLIDVELICDACFFYPKDTDEDCPYENDPDLYDEDFSQIKFNDDNDLLSFLTD